MTLFIRLLGSPEIRINEAAIDIPGQKPLALFAYLLVTGAAHSREHLADLLYEDSSDPRASLRWTLSHLRQALVLDFINPYQI